MHVRMWVAVSSTFWGSAIFAWVLAPKNDLFASFSAFWAIPPQCSGSNGNGPLSQCTLVVAKTYGESEASTAWTMMFCGA